ncbi:hypothetical protein FQR65_LT05866 [Abscondita terminalis]|nr:hypothetical protein FQR65_LT05866 [Abscondita terminalis]
MNQKISYRASERNKDPILAVLQKHIPSNVQGNLLEIGSGTGQHSSFFAQYFPNLTFHTSEYEKSLFASLSLRKRYSYKNVKDPIHMTSQHHILMNLRPYAYDGIITPQSNIDFDRGLRMQNSEWGLRDISDLKILAKENQMTLLELHDMPSNNKCLIWKRLE